jgi:hypothetical protein
MPFRVRKLTGDGAANGGIPQLDWILPVPYNSQQELRGTDAKIGEPYAVNGIDGFR